MKDEIKSAGDFLSNILRSKCVDSDKVHNFNIGLQDMLAKRYADHWFPEKPFKGSGFRCLRINHKIDPIVLQAGFKCGLTHSSMLDLLPKELTMWVDPQEVSYRIGENGSIGVLYEVTNQNVNETCTSSSTDNQKSSSPVSVQSSDSESDSDFLLDNSNSQVYSSCKSEAFHVSGVAKENLKQLAAFVYS